jgi:hypothetical protein
MEDQRFKKLFNDPKYKSAPKGVRKIEVSDKRFSHMFTDSRFSNTADLDEYGNKRKNKDKNYNKDLEEFYTNNNIILEGKNKELSKLNKKNNNTNKKFEKNNSNNKKRFEEDSDSMPELIDENDGNLSSNKDSKQQKPVLNKKLDDNNDDDGTEEEVEEDIENDSFNADEYREEDDDSDTSQEFEDFLNEHVDKNAEGDDAWDKYKDKDIPLGDATKRISVVNLDWENLTAKDIFVIFNSLSPKTDMILKVSIYPSDFGLKEMAKEKQHGPDREIFEDKKKNKDTRAVIHSIDEVEKLDKEKEFKGYNESKLREYELKKLRYYYAVVEFKSLKVANFIYENYDGMELERTQMFLDMRFVPEDLEFPHKPKEFCDSLPENYEMKIKSNRALEHSKVKLTWDQDNDKRSNLLKRAFDSKFNEDEIQELLVSSDEDDDEDTKKIAEILLKDDEENLKNGKNQIKLLNKKSKGGNNKEFKFKDGQDIEIVFDKGFEGLDKNLSKETIPNIKDKSLFEQYKERKKIIGKQKRIEETLKRDEKNRKRRYMDQDNDSSDEEEYNENIKKNKNGDDLDLLLQEDDYIDNKNTAKDNKLLGNIDKRFEAVKNNKDFWVDPTSKNFNKKKLNK